VPQKGNKSERKGAKNSNIFPALLQSCVKVLTRVVYPTGGSLRVFKPFAWLEVGSIKIALSRPAHQRVTLTVGLLRYYQKGVGYE
jgi:hypothetical protein